MQNIETRNGWMLKQEKGLFLEPLVKPCKKRQSEFSSSMDQICYKQPYKYNMRVRVDPSQSVSLEEAQVTMRLLDEKLKVVERNGNDKSSLPLMNCTKVKYNKKRKSIEIGAFFFNICSYKHGKKHFRLEVTVHMKGNVLSQMISEAFLVKAKKPIARPGSKKLKKKEIVQPPESMNKKRKCEDVDPIPLKKQRINEISPLPMIDSAKLKHLSATRLFNTPTLFNGITYMSMSPQFFSPTIALTTPLSSSEYKKFLTPTNTPKGWYDSKLVGMQQNGMFDETYLNQGNESNLQSVLNQEAFTL